jgi:hypothetical protein
VPLTTAVAALVVRGEARRESMSIPVLDG